MLNILLFFPKHWLTEFHKPTQAPFGLMMISHLLTENGYKIKIFDERLEQNTEELLKKELKNTDILGISAQSGPQINNGLKAAKLTREINSNIKIIWGGVHATLLPEQTLKNKYVDIIVYGEGEETFLELIQAIDKGLSLKNIKGIGYKESNKIILNEKRELIENIDKINLRWDLVNPKDYIHNFEKKKSISTITSRGCYFRCSFCYNQTFFGARYFRGFSPEKVLEEIKFLLDLKVETIKFEDDNFLVDKNRTKEICNLIKQEKLDFTWSAPIRAHYFTEEFTKEITSVGYKYCNIGAESGSERILKLMKKDTISQHYIDAARIAKKYNISTSYHWMLGYPTETQEDINDTISAINKIEEIYPNSYHILNIFTPYPGTEAYDLAIEHGFNPPNNLENWTKNFREECSNLVYIQNKKLLENIRLTGILKTLGKRPNWYRPLFRPGIKIFSSIAKKRWEKQNFNYPYDLKLIKLLKEKYME